MMSNKAKLAGHIDVDLEVVKNVFVLESMALSKELLLGKIMQLSFENTRIISSLLLKNAVKFKGLSKLLNELKKILNAYNPPTDAHKTLISNNNQIAALLKGLYNGSDPSETSTNTVVEEESLPVVDPPYLPPLLNSEKYTLVLDLDETLVHYYESENQGHVLVRPGAEDFLEEMSKYYEIVIFTAALQDYADWVIDLLDENKKVAHRLYRQHVVNLDKGLAKDLARLGRDLGKTVIVDNLAENFQLQPENGIMIKSWTDDPDDTALLELSQALIKIVDKRMDVRTALRSFSEQMKEQQAKGVQKPSLTLDDVN